MKRILAAAAAALTLAACTDAPVAVRTAGDAQPLASSSGSQWTIFTTQTPTINWTAANVEVGTRFRATRPACIVGFRFWRADGETAATHTFRLWFDSGTLWTSKSITGSGSGWQYAYTTGFACLEVGDYYRVSVNTAAKHVEAAGAFSGGAKIVNGPLEAVAGVYTQPTGSFPQYSSTHSFFVDVIADTSIVY